MLRVIFRLPKIALTLQLWSQSSGRQEQFGLAPRRAFGDKWSQCLHWALYKYWLENIAPIALLAGQKDSSVALQNWWLFQLSVPLNLGFVCKHKSCEAPKRQTGRCLKGPI